MGNEGAFLRGFGWVQEIRKEREEKKKKQKAEKDVQAVNDKSMAGSNRALDDARTAALKYHENVTIHV